MIINHNTSAMFAQRTNGIVDDRLTKNIESLSSGYRINRAGDDAAGLAVSEKMRSQIRGLNQASRNAQDGISFIQTTEGYLQESQDVLHRIRELAIQAANGIYTDEDRLQIQVEVSQLVDEIDRVASHAQFNELNMLTGRFSNPAVGVPTASMWFFIGANMDQREQVFIGTMTVEGLGFNGQLAGGANVRDAGTLTPDNANQTLGIVDAALLLINKQRADLGGFQNRLELAIQGIDVGAENLQASESRIRDVDMAREVVEFATNQILIQSSTAMLAQANVKSQSVLQLLG